MAVATTLERLRNELNNPNNQDLPLESIKDLLSKHVDDLESETNGNGSNVTPADVSDLALWLDASTLALADNDPVALWSDSSPNGYNAAQIDVTHQPIFKASIQNGMPAVRFSEDALAVPYLNLSGDALGIFRNVAGCTIFAVANYMGQRADQRMFWASYAADTEQPRVNFGEGGFSVDLAEDGDVLSSSFPDFDNFGADTVQTLLIAVGWSDWGISGAALSEYAGTLPVLPSATGWHTPANTPDSNSAAVRIGYAIANAPGLYLDLAELVVYTRALNALERRQIAEYLSVKWATL